jgi:hypothetical protein
MLLRTLSTVIATCALVVATAPAVAQGRILSKSRAQVAAKSAASRLARKRSGDAARPSYSKPRCARRSRLRFVCTTTIRGMAACDPTEAACDGPAAWELSYRITVKSRSARSNRLRVTAEEI